MSTEIAVSDYINKMAKASQTPQHEVILECMEYFGVTGTSELTLEQAAEYWHLFRKR